MANIYDETQQPSDQAPAQASQSDVAGQWRNWIGDPSNRAALMQFGISLMQPIAPGQSAFGHFGQALGSAGEAVARKQALDIRQSEAESKAAQREATAQLAESRARETAGTSEARRVGAEAAAQRAESAGQMLSLREALGGQTTGAALAKEYYNAKLINPSLTIEEFQKTVGQLTPARTLGAQPGAGAGVTPPGTRPPKPGDVVRGYRFKGGNPNDRTSWEPAE